MEEYNINNTQVQKPRGKGFGTAGFVVSLIALVFWFIISGIAVFSAALGGGLGIAIFWLILSLLGTILSIIGMNKLGKSSGKRGLAITGLILGIVSTILTINTLIAVNKVHNTVGDKGKEFLENLADTAKLRETINNAMETIVDSLKTH